MKHNYFTLLLALLMSMVSNVVFAYDAYIDGIYYNLIVDEAQVTGLAPGINRNRDAYQGDLVIPASVTIDDKVYPVTSIGNYAFSLCYKITSIVIPETVYSIGNNAFWYCSGLTSINIPNGVTTIDNSTFNKCSSLVSISIPQSVTSIGSSAFEGCTGLTSISIPNSVTEIGNSAFKNCTGLTSINIPESVLKVNQYAFQGCTGLTKAEFASVGSFFNIEFDGWESNPLYYAHHLYVDGKEIKDLVIPNGVTVIDRLHDCVGFTSISFPESVISINSSLSDCKDLTKVEFASVESFYSINFMGSYSNPLKYAHYLYIDGNEVTELNIPNSVTTIDDRISGCPNITSVSIPSSVTIIGDNAFYGCIGITSISIPESVTSIGNAAFRGCSGLSAISIPRNVISIDYNAFTECENIETIVVDPENAIFDSRNNCNAIIKKDGDVLVTGCMNTQIPIGVTKIASTAFSGCSRLTSIIIPEGVTEIQSWSFWHCYNLKEIVFPESLTRISFNVFEDCIGLTSITIPENVTYIDPMAFTGCINLASITFNCTNVGDYFKGFSYLKDITLGDKVTSVASNAFEGTIWFENQPEGLVYVGKVAYKYKGTMPANTELVLKEGTVSITGSAFNGCNGLTSIEIPNSVVVIGESAFGDCTELKKVTIKSNAIASQSYNIRNTLSTIFGSQVENYTFGEGVETIGKYACYKCENLTSVSIASSVTVIGSFAFHICRNLTKAEFASVESLCGITFDNISSNPLYCGPYLYINGEEVTDLFIPNSVTSIGKFTFTYCSGLISVTIPNSVTSIGSSAFEGCYDLTTVIIPNSVTSIGERAFSYCSGLTSINIPNSVTEIGNSAFWNCTGLTSITIPNSMTEISKSTFNGCSGLTSIIIPNSVTSIGSSAFSGCQSLKDVYCLAENIPSAEINSFSFADATLHVPASSIEAYKATEPWSKFGNIVALTDEETSLTAIDNGELKFDKVYDMNGCKLSQTQRGINIIRMKDGTTKKVLIK